MLVGGRTRKTGVGLYIPEDPLQSQAIQPSASQSTRMQLAGRPASARLYTWDIVGGYQQEVESILILKSLHMFTDVDTWAHGLQCYA